MAYRSIVRGISAHRGSRNARNAPASRLPASRSSQPTALWMRSCGWCSRMSAIANVSPSSPRRTNAIVLTIPIRRSQMLLPSRASRYSTPLSLSTSHSPSNA